MSVLANFALEFMVCICTVFSQTANVTNATTHAPLPKTTVTSATSTTAAAGNATTAIIKVLITQKSASLSECYLKRLTK